MGFQNIKMFKKIKLFYFIFWNTGQNGLDDMLSPPFFWENNKKMTLLAWFSKKKMCETNSSTDKNEEKMRLQAENAINEPNFLLIFELGTRKNSMMYIQSKLFPFDRIVFEVSQNIFL